MITFSIAMMMLTIIVFGYITFDIGRYYVLGDIKGLRFSYFVACGLVAIAFWWVQFFFEMNAKFADLQIDLRQIQEQCNMVRPARMVGYANHNGAMP